jgi:hypothetical protein
MEPIPEWDLIERLYEIHDELPEDAEDFVINLKENVNPYEPLRDQLIGLPESVERQEKWLHSLYERFCNEDEDAAEEIWDDAG